MKTSIVALIVAMSLILGSSVGLAEMPEKATDRGIHTMTQSSEQIAEGSKGLDKPLVVPNGQDSWVLHQPMERYPMYFNSTNGNQENRQSVRKENHKNN